MCHHPWNSRGSMDTLESRLRPTFRGKESSEKKRSNSRSILSLDVFALSSKKTMRCASYRIHANTPNGSVPWSRSKTCVRLSPGTIGKPLRPVFPNRPRSLCVRYSVSGRLTRTERARNSPVVHDHGRPATVAHSDTARYRVVNNERAATGSRYRCPYRRVRHSGLSSQTAQAGPCSPQTAPSEGVRACRSQHRRCVGAWRENNQMRRHHTRLLLLLLLFVGQTKQRRRQGGGRSEDLLRNAGRPSALVLGHTRRHVSMAMREATKTHRLQCTTRAPGPI